MECETKELAERWRVAGLILRRIDPGAFDALLVAAEVIVVETPEQNGVITLVDLVT